MTRDEFNLGIARISFLRGAPDDAEGHFAALEDLPVDVFERACQHALKTRAWFPLPAELRADADASRPAVAYVPEPERFVPASGARHEIKNPFGGKSIIVTVEREWRDDCERCRDLGKRSWWCGVPSNRYLDMPSMHCGRRGDHEAHEWVDTCDCVNWNPTIKRRKAAQQASYAKPAERV